jgi:hypothetical protein
MSEFSQVRSFNLGIAEETSVEAALIYDDLAYAQKVFGKGYFFRSDKQMLVRFPIFSKNTIRRHVAKLVEAGWISTKVKMIDGKPILHYQIEQNLIPKMGKTIEIPKMGKTYIETKETTKNNAKSQLLALVNEITGRQFRTLPEKGVKKTLDAFTIEEIRTALTALARDPWHQPKLKELSIDYFIRSTTIDRFMGKAPAPGAVQPTWTEDDDGNRYYKGELLTPQNQERIMRENQAERNGTK